MKILKIYFQYLRNEAHYQFLLLVQKLFSIYPDVAAIVSDLLPAFNEGIALEGKLVDAVKASGRTEELVKADQRVDRDLVGINSAVNAALHHFDPTVVAAAKNLALRLKSFRGGIEKKSYEEESAAVKILVKDLQTTYATEVTTVGLEGWVRDLSLSQIDFEDIFVLRNKELTNRPQERLEDVRKENDTRYHGITDRIDAYTTLNGDATCGVFIGELNHEITYFKEHSHRHAKKDIATALVDEIPPQPYVKEMPATPIPRVWYREKEDQPLTPLVFAKDFDVLYKHNDQIGNAELFIRGKGAYKGKKEVTFIIEQSNEQRAMNNE
jgi:hypothetical protein